MADTMSAARAMWTMFEPVHDVAYFAPEALSAFTGAGLRGTGAVTSPGGQRR